MDGLNAEPSSLDQDREGLKNLAELYAEAKALILYSEQIDPDSRSNLQVIKELRDAFDHLMRVIATRTTDRTLSDADDPDYCRKHIQKSVGHVYRAAFDALDGTVLSLITKITEVVDHYPPEVLNQVIPNYWEMKSELYKLSGKIADHRARKDVGAQIGLTLDRYVQDIEVVKGFYQTVLDCGPSLEECAAQYKKHNTKAKRKDLFEKILLVILSVVLTLIARHFIPL
ncbi:hypothetical protein HW932_03915 [Allochromatium humboldtianum]|uniref:Uncharacterized protein n=1 Tax=Allochromatium humboldtianum TaxID=504901 RepID=A0A850RAU5_9GAMM|nr:hypothetical protein [Allochromatium humboldtianum]NVZ08402.1 hypothetical protein [Allochromatium humboldtianum]